MFSFVQMTEDIFKQPEKTLRENSIQIYPEWIRKKSDLKFSNIDEFAKYGLVNIRDRVSDDLKLEKMNKHKSTALVIRLMDKFHIGLVQINMLRKTARMV